MATKKTRKAVPKPRKKAGTRAKTTRRARPALECGVCGYRVIVDEACGCAEEHVLICCGQPMARK
jgi:hypothetical protein